MALVNEYTFGEMTGTSLVDSIGTNNGTLGGATLPTWTRSLDLSKVRTQLDFTGGNGFTGGNRQRVNLVATNFQYSISSNFSLCVLFKTSKTDTTVHNLFSHRGTASPYIYFSINPEEKVYIQISTANGAFKSYTSTATYNDGKWHLAVMTYAASGLTLNLYIDGVLRNEGVANSGTMSGDFYDATNLPVLGAFSLDGGTNYVADLTGSIAYFANYNHTLSAAEVQRITEEQLYKVNSRDSGATYRYLPPKNSIRDGLVNEYFLDSPDGVDTVKDYKGTNNGTKGGATKPASAVAPNGMNSLAFTGGNGSTAGDRQRVELTRTSFEYSSSSNFSIVVLFKSSKSDANAHALFQVIENTSNVYTRIFIDGTEKIYAMISSSTGNYKLFNPATNYCDGKWHLVVMTYASDKTFKLYIDSIDMGASTNTGTLSGNFYEANHKATIGAQWVQATSNYINDFTGSIAYFANYNRVLSATEVDKLYRDTYIN